MARASAIEVVDRGRRLSFSFADLMTYHGGGSPGGVAHAFKVLERALPLLDPRVRASAGRSWWTPPSAGPGRVTLSRW